MAACGGGSNSTPPPSNPVAPTVTVSPASSSVTTAQPLSVTVAVAGSAGTPTGSVTLKSGSYTSLSSTLSGGSASINVPAGALPTGSDSLAASYTPDSASSSRYTTASGSSLVTVSKATPSVTVTPASSTIQMNQALNVTISVSGGAGAATVTGSVVLSSGTYNSAPATLSNGSAIISISAGSLAIAADTLTATFTPDTSAEAIYNGSSGTASVTVTKIIPTVTVMPALQNINTQQSLSVTVTVNGGSGNPAATGSVVLNSGAYASAASALSSGSTVINIPAAALASGSDTLAAAYTPDSAGAATYGSASGAAGVTVTRVTPAVKVTPASLNVTTAQSLNVEVDVTVPSGDTSPTGTVVLKGGAYTSSAATLSSGVANIVITPGTLSPGSVAFSATYTPDAAGGAIYAASSGTSSSVTVTLLSTVTVNQAVSGPAITDQLLGMNMAAWWDPTTSYVIPAFQTAGIKALRWPGGSWSDVYHWNGNFTCQGTPPNLSPGGWAHPNAVYTEFINDVEIPGGFDVALTADYGTDAACTGPGDPTEAAGWVKAWETAGGTLSHVTVGNEVYGSWETDVHTKPNDPATYAGAVAGASGYYSDIKAVDKKVLVGVAVDAGVINANWDPTVLSNAKGSYDFIELHYYARNPGQESDSFLIYDAAPELTSQINTLKQELATAGSANTPIYIGEIGSVSSNPGKTSWSITQGLYAGQALGEMMNAGVSRLTWWIGFGNCNGSVGNDSSSLYGWQTFGAYNIFSDEDPSCPGEGAGGTMSPTAQAFNLYQNVLVNGESVLTPTVVGDTTNVRAYAATHSGGTALVLLNLNEVTGEPVQITLSGQKSSAGVTVITYSKAIYDQTDATPPVWGPATTTKLGAKALPLSLTLDPWSMNVVLIQ